MASRVSDSATYAGASNASSRPGVFYSAGPSLSLGGAVQTKMADSPAASPLATMPMEAAEPISPQAPIQQQLDPEAEEVSPADVSEPVQMQVSTDSSQAMESQESSSDEAPIQEAAASGGAGATGGTGSAGASGGGGGFSGAGSSVGANGPTGPPAGSSSMGGSIQSIASRGMQSTGQPLPGLDHIQSSFGHHELPDVRAHVGSEAVSANRQMGSRAYTRGHDVAFGETPDIKLAAHEAAHVVQQRRGVHLKGEVGTPGDVLRAPGRRSRGRSKRRPLRRAHPRP